jgi:hypothetical protein
MTGHPFVDGDGRKHSHRSGQGGSLTNNTLLALAERLVVAYVAHTAPRAVLLTGSTALGLTDAFSDVDLIAYYDTPPSENQLEAAQTQLGGTGYRRPRPSVEDYHADGVHCEVGHFLVADFERRMATVLDAFEVETTVHRELMGLLEGRPLYGDDLIGAWQARAAAFPEGLRQAMVEYYLRKLFSLWYSGTHLSQRDARLWMQQELVQGAFSVLGVLAGLNRCYFSPFQFKRARQFVAGLALAPGDLADRLDALLAVPMAAAITELEQVVAETLALVEHHLPTADTRALRHAPGAREQPWRAPA